MAGTVDLLNLGALPPGVEIAIPLSAHVAASTPAGPVPGTALVGSGTPDPLPDNNSSTVSFTW